MHSLKKRLIVPITCPWDRHGNLIVADLDKHLGFLSHHPVFVNGEMGEHRVISQQRRKQVMKLISDDYRGPVLLGVTSPFVHETYELIGYADRLESIAVVLRPGAMNHLDSGDLEGFVSKAASITKKDIYLYHNSSKDHPLLNPKNVKLLSDMYGQLAGIKVTAGMEETRMFLDQEYRDGFSVYIGNPDVLLDIDMKYQPKVAGAVIGTANVLPEAWSNVLKAFYDIKSGSVRDSGHCIKEIGAIDEFSIMQAEHGLSTLAAIKNYLYEAYIYSSTHCCRPAARCDSLDFRSGLRESLIAP
jgi:dihydrodipicolinate synthase/N-acetylneuraminate lyase